MIHKRVGVCAVLCTAMLLCSLACLAATTMPEMSADAYWAELSNRYVTVQLGGEGTVKPSGTDWSIPGRWMVATVEGDPETTGDNRHALVYFPRTSSITVPCDYFGFIKVKVGDNVKMIGDSNTGYWSMEPYAYTTPRSGYGMGKTGGYIEAEWVIRPDTSTGDTDTGTTTNPPSVTQASIHRYVAKAATARPAATTTTGGVVVHIKMSIVRDQCRFEFTLTNAGTTSQSIGLQLVGDVMVDENSTTGFPFIPGYGCTKSETTPYPMVISGTSIPDCFETYDSVENPVVVARNTLKLQDCTSPDYLVLGDAADLASATNWMPDDFEPIYDRPIEDLAWSLTWKPKTLGSGFARKIITYYGVGAASTAWTYKVGTTVQSDHVALAVQGPRSLKYDSTVVGTNDLSPAPFTIDAYVYNMATDAGLYQLDDVTVTLYLPSGLALSPASTQTAQQSIGSVPINSESTAVEWTVQATGEYSGELEYYVTARASSGWQQVVSRKIMVPATKKTVFRSGWQMMHVPFGFNNPAIEHALGLASGSFAARYYDPSSKQYMPVKELVPGQAFWMYVANIDDGATMSAQLADDAAVVGASLMKQSEVHSVDLSTGWNLIGNPFLYPIYWGQVQVCNTRTGSGAISLDEAVKNNWLSKTLFSWEPQSGTYQNFKDNAKQLLPWRGYWLLAKCPITLVFTPAVAPESDVTTKLGGY